MHICAFVLKVVIFVTCALNIGVFGEKWLDNFVSYYELTNNHDFLQRSRRSASNALENGDEIVYPIRAFNRSFVLLLRQDNSIFSDEHQIENGGEVLNFKTPVLVRGFVQGAADSFVHGSLINDRFEGEVRVGPDTLMVENAEKFIESPSLRQKQTSVVYRAADITLNAHQSPKLLDRRKRSVDDAHHDYSLCGWSHDHIRDSLTDQQQSAQPSEKYSFKSHKDTDSIYSEAANRPHNHVKRAAFKRAAINSETRQPGLLSESSLLNKPKVCGLFMQVDHLLYDKYFKQANSDHDALANIIAYLGFVAQKANFIYNSTEFHTRDGRVGPFRNIHITIMRTKIYKTESEFAKAFELRPTEAITNLDATNFLNLISRSNNDKYCAAYVFTLRDFSSGILGLAWIGYPDAVQRGGVCDQYGATRTGRQSLNTGIVTLLNYGQQVNRLVSAITFAHELGHNFGAQHDNTPLEVGREPDPSCFPGGDEGNYIMYSSATSGLKVNNEKFSECSRDSITRNINAILRNQASKTNCFRDSDQPFCGNSVVDPGEDCDCGFKDDCGIDYNCCGAADDPQIMRCRFKKVAATTKKAQCSLSNGVCCDVNTCEYTPRSSNYICRPADECNREAHCNGMSAQCPRGIPEHDGKLCANRTKICQSGDCSISSCEIIAEGQSNGAGSGAKFTGCQSERPSGQTKYNRSELCYLSCKAPTTGKCFNSIYVQSPDFDPDFLKFLSENSNRQPIQLLAGSPCDNDRGYCDVFHRCRPVNADGPLARLKDMLFSEQTISTLRSWVEKYWWGVMLLGVAIICFMVAFVKICSVHTPSDNRNLPPARSIADTLRRTSMKPIVYLVNRGGPAHGRGPGHRRMAPGHLEGDSSRPHGGRSSQASAPPLPPNLQLARSGRPPTYQETFA